MTTTVISIKDAPKGWMSDPSFVYIGRHRVDMSYEEAERGFDGRFGNIFVLRLEKHREQIVGMYERWFLKKLDNDPAFRRRVVGLRGKTLVCFCAPRTCHGDVIARWVDALIS